MLFLLLHVEGKKQEKKGGLLYLLLIFSKHQKRTRPFFIYLYSARLRTTQKPLVKLREIELRLRWSLLAVQVAAIHIS